MPIPTISMPFSFAKDQGSGRGGGARLGHVFELPHEAAEDFLRLAFVGLRPAGELCETRTGSPAGRP